jgi:hypothetical protein
MAKAAMRGVDTLPDPRWLGFGKSGGGKGDGWPRKDLKTLLFLTRHIQRHQHKGDFISTVLEISN